MSTAAHGWPEGAPEREARITARRQTTLSPWVSLVEREIDFPHIAEPQIYHGFAQADTVGILAVTEDGWIPVVRQFRPAVESSTWELPAGMLDPGEDAEECCRRELLEETGIEARELIHTGSGWADTARLGHRHHSWFVRASRQHADFAGEPGVEVALVRPAELRGAILRGTFNHQLHLATIYSAVLRGLFDITASA